MSSAQKKQNPYCIGRFLTAKVKENSFDVSQQKSKWCLTEKVFNSCTNILLGYWTVRLEVQFSGKTGADHNI